MGRLVFVGAGLNGTGSLTVDALQEISEADCIFMEAYTTFIPREFEEELFRRTGKRVKRLSRGEVERGSIVIGAAMKSRCVFISGGDPMSATTHVSMRLSAKKHGIDTVIIPAPSILTAAASFLGLQHYRFGRIVSMPQFTASFRPASPIRNVEFNLKNGLHTLVLLDVDESRNYYMQPDECMSQLLELSSRERSTAFSEERIICVVSRAGMKSMETVAGTVSSMLKRDFGEPPHCIIIPSKLHFEEAEALVAFSGASIDELRHLID
ncbi:MAG: diphthine synthase [Candidatus Thermoplasmatota archaeon]|jgi:diphthine synthase|nr:diphthine synthase [Candidatus Sysuiplasma jiujiangense]MBX8638800.1 diphthine synthase [Candidatus Sysuiplasma jiujiangense]MBX8641084.1 diphthine synthase [Candidatus Sysuiplasma jiujiangense]MCL4316791.1 diphthine synthase [Candidatus Thermoplasmatota archaeon]MCL5253563.1 diphthine synthase [Candidatus Thermoplasmatota archaeon]